MSEPPHRAPHPLSGASGSQGDPERRRAEENKGLTTEALAAHGGDSFSHLHRRVAASVSRSNCPASSSTAIEGPEEYEKLKMKMDEYIMHEEYYKSIRREDGEEPLAVHGSRPRTDLGSYAHSGPPSTASLPRRLRPEYPTPRAPELALHESKNIIQGQPTVPWIKRPSCWPNSCLDQKIQMLRPYQRPLRLNWVLQNPYPSLSSSLSLQG